MIRLVCNRNNKDKKTFVVEVRRTNKIEGENIIRKLKNSFKKKKGEVS